MLRRKFFMAVVAAAVAGLLGPASARAGFVVRIERLDVTTGTVLNTLDGNGAVAGSPDVQDKVASPSANPDSIDFDPSKGNIAINADDKLGVVGLQLSITSDSHHDVANALLNQVETTAANHTGVAQRIRVTVSDTDYNGPSQSANPLFLIGSTVFNNVGTTGLSFASNGGFSGYGNLSNLEFDQSGVSISVSTPTKDSQTVQTTWNRGPGPFSLTMVMDFTLATDGSVKGLTGTVNVVPAVPAPATAILALAGAPLFGVFGWMRRRKAVVA
jgi:hypothetical protein